MENLSNILKRHWVILDIEAVSLNKSRTGQDYLPWGQYTLIHCCLRKIGVVLYNGDRFSLEFTPCLMWENLSDKEKERHNICEKFIHKLPYSPEISNAQLLVPLVSF